jgi:hypothetical protein
VRLRTQLSWFDTLAQQDAPAVQAAAPLYVIRDA